ncbi:MAG: hypothetical protein BWZ10_02716 [candidate division BRC1 bacterium ADurb.BinA364]|nr:MAG: hypothetical protein BWZ10_02716 [candidate division BRC1 bacterium ADurb.BinA364]
MSNSQGSAAETLPQEERIVREPLIAYAAQTKFWEDAFHTLHVTIDGEDFEDVRPVCLFPVTEKANYVAFMNKKGKEVAMLRDPKNLDKASAAALKRALARMYYAATILKVHRVSEQMGISRWEVTTDRGYACFEIINRQRIRELDGGGFLIADADGNRFIIPSMDDLDEESQEMVLSET